MSFPDDPISLPHFTAGGVGTAALDDLVEWLNTLAERVTDTGLVTTGSDVTATTGWGSLTFRYRIRAGEVTLTINATRTGSTLTASSSGALADTDVATVSALLTPSDSNVYGIFIGANTSGGCVLDTSGKFTILDAHPTSTVATSDVIHATFQYPAA